ncbi:putative feruloyl esterase [Colletotrichum spaethianum]|uniref:Carboxylic ester hydrolase n=1 Tax=Colletotrichum spaethianum TaxID=700344 RepID=A0AA37NV37_9PEZI|nr:putative feruloyl esterase [Colletotrichum spaethianum]GKT42802.1 putative feruloyl esterase [Colletotrichum spaethianum]
MDQLGEYPPACEINAITSAALKTCDGADGIEDGGVADTDSCLFDSATVPGSTVNCTALGSERKVSAAAAGIVRRVWDGARRASNTTIWFGASNEAILTGSITDVAVVPTTCAANGTRTDDWLKVFLLKNSSATAANMTHADDFSRFFLAPSVNHCFGGNGAYPASTFDAMREWVENGMAPDTLMASTVWFTPAF